MIGWVKSMLGVHCRKSQREDMRQLRELAIAQNERATANAVRGIRTNAREMETMRGMLELVVEPNEN